MTTTVTCDYCKREMKGFTRLPGRPLNYTVRCNGFNISIDVTTFPATPDGGVGHDVCLDCVYKAISDAHRPRF